MATDAVVKLGYSGWVKLLLFDPYPIFEDLLPSFPEQPRAVSGTPTGLRNLVHIAILIIATHDGPQLCKLLDYLL